jgi:glycerol uptake facilitator-like aquaporin
MGEFQNAYVWILGPILGALVAAIGYQLLAPKGLEQVSN